ncbi:hypothetical protein NQZ68_035548 [Dissostichus eleginoides]|nr:hypothetical protein NQZ68_035548 [Dissostichus eleginoides]
MTGEFDSYNTPRHDSQMGASSGRICHHNGNAERGRMEERRFDKCVMHAPVTAAAIREQWALFISMKEMMQAPLLIDSGDSMHF